MAISSVMLPLGTIAPPFSLRDVVSGRSYSLASFSGKAALLVMFICRHCPYVVHVEHEILTQTVAGSIVLAAPLLPQFVAHGTAVHARHRVDLIFATGNPSSVPASARVSSRMARA